MKKPPASGFLAPAAFLAFALAFGFAAPAAGQESPFVPDKLALLLRDELSGDRAFNFVRALTPYHRIMGSRTYAEAAEMLAGLARRSGLENVQVVTQKFPGGLSWDARSAKLWLITPEEIKLCDFEELPVSLAVFSRSAHAEAELVDIGRASSAEDFAGLDVAGKIVLTTAAPSQAVRTAVWERGALGVVSSGGIHPDAKFDTPDQIAYIKVPAACPAGKTQPWAFMISPRRYGYLQDLLRKAKAMKIAVRVRAVIDTEIREPAEQAYLWAEMTGSAVHNQDIVLTAHLDEESTSANDNGSGCGAQLEIGRAIDALVKSGKMPRPRRDIVFWWPNEHASEYQYLRERPEERKNWLASLNMDMVGARQSMGSRVQHIVRTPYSLPSYLNDVVESITEYVIAGHTASLAADEVGIPQPFPKPLLSFKGSRERFDAIVVPHSGGSDHEVFCEGVVGVPAVGLLNNPDPYFHSSDDDLQNIDATQLKRNAFIVAAATLFLANAGDGDVPMLAGEVFSRGVKRLGADLNTALAHLRAGSGGDAAKRYAEARNLLEQAGSREEQAVSSVLVFAEPAGPNAALVRKWAAKIRETAAGLARELDACYVRTSGAKTPPAVVLSAAEKAMAVLVPVNTGTLDEYFGKRGTSVAYPGLHSILVKECYGFVDGKRSYLDISRAIEAEALSAGASYYGTVPPGAVRAILDQAVAKGVLRLK